MRKLVGGAVLVVGVGALGFYANGNHAKRMQTRVTDAASSAVSGTTHDVMTEVAGRDIIVSGLAHDSAERDMIVASLNDLDGRRVVVDQLALLPVASPYQLMSVKAADGQTYTGQVPNSTVRAMMADDPSGMGAENAATLELASGMPDERWPEVGLMGLSALTPLEHGEMELLDRELRVTGMAATPDEQAEALALIAVLPEGYTSVVEIDTIIPMGMPYAMSSAKGMDGQTYTGMAPNDELLAEMATINGTPEGLSIAWGMPDDTWPDMSSLGLDALNLLETGEVSLVDRKLSIIGMAATPVEKAQAEELLANLPEGYSATTDIGTIISMATPYEMHSTKTQASQSFEGMLPSAEQLATMGRFNGSEEGLSLAWGMPDAAWPEVARSGFRALAVLETGEMSLVNQTLTVTGTAATPVEQARANALIASLPEEYDTIVSIDTRISMATPYEMHSVKTADGQSYQGVLPDSGKLGALVGELGTHEGLSLAWGMPDDAWPDVARQGFSALDPLEYGEMALVDRRLTVTGMAATPVEQAEAYALVASLPGGYSKIVQIDTLLPLAEPYQMTSSKGADSQTYAGDIPDEQTRAGMIGAMGAGASDLGLAYGMPDAAWPTIATKGLAVLDTLVTGEMTLVDRVLTVTGTALSPTEKAAALAVLENLPEGYSQTADIDVLDDGTPIAYAITYASGQVPEVTGKLPVGANLTSIATALGVPEVTGTPVMGAMGGPEAAADLHAKLAGFSQWMPDIQELSYGVDDGALSVFSKLRPGMDKDALAGQWASILGDAELVVEAEALPAPEPAPEPEPVIAEQEGDRRYNSVTSHQEIYMGGYWIAITDFSTTSENCAATASEVLDTAKINFFSGSAELDPSSFRAINSLAALIRECLDGNTDQVEVGGHTDSDGSEELNENLSLARAQAVVDTLIAREVPQNRITARGYGESEPIATNDTSEGKAANRRTTIRWVEQ